MSGDEVKHFSHHSASSSDIQVLANFSSPEQSSVKRESKRFYFSVAFEEPESGNSYFSAKVKADI